MSERQSEWKKSDTAIAIFVLVVIVMPFLFWLLCLNHTGVNQVGIAYNSLNGKINVQEHPGWYLTSPFVKVVKLSTLPLRLEIPSAAKIINMRIVRFKPEGAEEFVKLQGFSWYLGSELENIMLGYAFSGKSYPFLEIMQQGGPEDTSSTQK